MIICNTKSLANAVGGKTARACDGCVKRRARWYCAADDAFLCHACDGTVHSANPLARRHERVRLKSASSVASNLASTTWHRGFTKKARTPRGGSGKRSLSPVVHDLVPVLSADDQTDNNEEEQLIYRVPVFDPIVAEQCENDAVESKGEFLLSGCVNYADDNNTESCLNQFFPTDLELAEFAADMETLLGRGLETESFAMNEPSLVEGSSVSGQSSLILKVEDDDEEEGVMLREAVNTKLSNRDNVGEAFDLGFDYESHATCGEEDHDNEVIVKGEDDPGERGDCCVVKENRKVLSLRLDYEAVIATWGAQGLPWTAGERPAVETDDGCWPACTGTCGAQVHFPYGFMGGGIGLLPAYGDGGREARVSRYREKRRTRLFSKKIRYEVRKLNAEKRPRMKGRFVKRASFAASAAISSA